MSPPASRAAPRGARAAGAAQAQAAQFAQTRGGGGSTRGPLEGAQQNQNDGRAPVGVQWPAASRRSGSGGSWPRAPRAARAWRLSAQQGTPNAPLLILATPRRPGRAPGRRAPGRRRERAGHAVEQGARELASSLYTPVRWRRSVGAPPPATPRRTRAARTRRPRPRAERGRRAEPPYPNARLNQLKQWSVAPSSPPFWRSSVEKPRRPRRTIDAATATVSKLKMQRQARRGGRSAFTIYAQDAGQRPELRREDDARRRHAQRHAAGAAPRERQRVLVDRALAIRNGPVGPASTPAAAAAAAPPSGGRTCAAKAAPVAAKKGSAATAHGSAVKPASLAATRTAPATCRSTHRAQPSATSWMILQRRRLFCGGARVLRATRRESHRCARATSAATAVQRHSRQMQAHGALKLRATITVTLRSRTLSSVGPPRRRHRRRQRLLHPHTSFFHSRHNALCLARGF